MNKPYHRILLVGKSGYSPFYLVGRAGLMIAPFEVQSPLRGAFAALRRLNSPLRRIFRTAGLNQINTADTNKKATPLGWPFYLVGRAGFEPATNWLKARLCL